MQRNLRNLGLFLIVAAAFCTMSTPSRADWDPNKPADQARAKWVQLPDLQPTGMDVLDTLQPFVPTPGEPQWKILADDFICTETGPITDVHIWGSWLNDQLPRDALGNPDPGALRFKLSFHDDVSATDPNNQFPYSHPGTQLWSAIFNPGQFIVNPNYVTFPVDEDFYDPNLDQIIGGDTHVYQYNFTTLLDAQGLPFIQEGTAANPKIYWLDVQTEVFSADGTTATFGWKTRENPLDPAFHFQDDAVFADTAGFAGPLTTAWKDMHYPLGHPAEGRSIDLSFVLTVPEPSSIAMAGLGLVALIGMVYRRRRNAAC